MNKIDLNDPRICIDCTGFSEDKKKRVQDAFKKLGCWWSWIDGGYQFLDRDVYANAESDGHYTRGLLYGNTINHIEKQYQHTYEQLMERAGMVDEVVVAKNYWDGESELEVGMIARLLNATTEITLNHHSEISGWHVLFADGSASLVSSHMIKPIKQKSAEELAIDDIAWFHNNQPIDTFNESLLKYIKADKIHGVKWAGDIK